MLLNIALFVLFKVLIDYTFVAAVSPLYAYAGFSTDINSFKLTLSYFVLVTLALLLPRRTRNSSDFALLILFVFIVIPILSLWGLQNESSSFALIVAASFVMLQLLMKLHFTHASVRDLRGGSRAYLVVALTFLGLLFLVLILRGGLQYLNLSFIKVYEIRSIITDEVLGGGLAYLWIWGGKSFLVVLMVVSLWRRKYFSFSICVALEVFLYALTTHKELLFYPLIIIAVYMVSIMRVNLIRVTLLGLSGILISAVLLDRATSNHLFLGVLVFRLFDVIGFNHFAYYHFFQDHPYVAFSNSFLSHFSEYPYNEPVPLLIGAGRYGLGSDAFVNAGYIASGYMQLGAAGIFLYTAILAMILKLFDLLTHDRMPLWAGTGIAAVSIFQLVNADLTTSLLTHGIALNLLGVWLIGSRHRNQMDARTANEAHSDPAFG